MNDPTLDETQRDARPGEGSRMIGRIVGDLPGPTLVAVAGIHGNEPAGVFAARRVLARLAELGAPLRGEFAALQGNMQALQAGRRFLDRDLNRHWTMEGLEQLADRDRHETLTHEDREELDLARALDGVLSDSRGGLFFIDLHTTSSAGYPFAMIQDRAEQRRFARNFPLPIILGLLDVVDGVLLKYMAELGCTCFGIEGGQNDDERSIDHHEAALWIALVSAGLVDAAHLPEFERSRAMLTRSSTGLPHFMEVVHRHAITLEDQFRMKPGYANIHPVQAGEVLARDCRGEIKAPWDGILFLPLYQGLGDDGFFLGREVAS